LTTKLEDLDFADDIALLSSTKQQIETKTDRLTHEAEKEGMWTNVNCCDSPKNDSPKNDCVGGYLRPRKGDESGADPRQQGEGRQGEKELDGRTGVRYTSQRPTELVGGRVLKHYVPHGMKRIGEGGGERPNDLL